MFYGDTRHGDRVCDTGCGAGNHRPTDITERYGDYVQTTSGGGENVYVDDYVSIKWSSRHDRLLLDLVNKTDHPIKIVWDESAFIDPDGISSRVMHEGVVYGNRSSSQPPTVVPRGGRILDQILPVSLASYSNSQWVHGPLFPGHTVPAFAYGKGRSRIINDFPQKEAEAKRTAEEIREKIRSTPSDLRDSLQVVLPISLKGVINDYHFVFDLVGVVVGETRIISRPQVLSSF